MAGKDTNTGAKRARETRELLGLDLEAPLPCIVHAVVDDLDAPGSPGDAHGGRLLPCALSWLRAHPRSRGERTSP